MTIKTALIQLNAKPAIEDNLRTAEGLIRAAVKEGAEFVLTPENTCRMRSDAAARWECSFEEADHPALHFYKNLARELSVHVLIGSLSSVRVGERQLANRSYLIGPDGGVRASYDKIHLFDVDLPNGEVYRESDLNRGGNRAVTVQVTGLEGAIIGLSVCYDVRFPQLYRALAQRGAQILTVPAAFTVPTGRAHWETLLRARAIENGAFVLAPAQGGAHEGGRATWGHSLAISPWGEIIAEIQGDGPGYAIFDLDLAAVTQARQSIPSLRHDKPFQN